MSNGPPELWLVRHGETEWSQAHRHTSFTDLPLTERGVADAQALGARLRRQSYDRVLTSPMRRARETAALAGFPTTEVEPAATEWHYGEYEGLTTVQVRERVPGWSVWTHGAPGGESAADVGARADRLIEAVRSRGSGRLLLFAHAHFLRVLAARWIDQPPAAGAHYRLDTASISVLAWERETAVISRWNT